MSYSTIIFDKKDNYAIITLNRPGKLNALNTMLFNELNDVLEKIELDREIKAVILTGSGDKAFAAGADIKELHESDDLSGKLFSEHGSKVMARLEQLKIPVIAAINGFALGGGCELTLACHIRFASDRAVMGQPEVNLGIIPGYGGTQRLPKIIGKARAMEFILSGNNIKAEEAERIGLVNRVFPHDELIDKTIDYVKTVLSKGPVAVSAAVEAINASQELSLLNGLKLESRKFGEVCGSADFKEGTKAFLEKRKAEFKGQ